ncbi:MAG: anaerobic ribonucleoside-triphosphate reductase activating protein, partial [Eubacteriales bacterium]|nr:anaerobic ribonucleoside-triphosphate reductase activating protein [Eubacteriales bacterium]
MKYHNITNDDMLNGEGLRVVLWVSGCEHKCKNCHNPITWNENGGLIFDENAKNEIFCKLEKDYIQGITFSGGDPLYRSNLKEITNLAKEIKEKYPQKDIWLYTGYKWEEIENLEIIKYLDVIIDGKYIEKFKDDSLH